jgi:ribonuclease HI
MQFFTRKTRGCNIFFNSANKEIFSAFCTSVGAELWAIANGLQLAWSKGFRKIILESDSSLAVDLITNDKVIIDKNYNLIMQARYFLAKNWDIQVIHVYREANSAQIG